MTDDWHQVMTTKTAMLPRKGWRGRWDAFRYAVRLDRSLRAEEGQITFSIWVKARPEDVRVDFAQAQVMSATGGGF